MNRFKFFVIIIILPLFVKCKSNSLFVKGVQIYQDSVCLKTVVDSSYYYDIIDPTTFSIKSYMSFFDEIEFEEGYYFGVHFLDEDFSGNPHLYALKEGQKLVDSDEEPLYKFLERPEVMAKNHIKPKDSDAGFLQYLFFSEMGEQFALKWHSYYGEVRIVSSSKELNDVIKKLTKSEDFSVDSTELLKLKDVSPKFLIKRDKEYCSITWIENATHAGIYRCTYQINRKEPYDIKRVKQESIVDIKLNFMY